MSASILLSLLKIRTEKALKEIIHGKGKYLEYLQSNVVLPLRCIKTYKKKCWKNYWSLPLVSPIFQLIYNLSTRRFKVKRNGSIKNNAAKDAVSLMSIHNAKGLEFPCVFYLERVMESCPILLL